MSVGFILHSFSILNEMTPNWLLNLPKKKEFKLHRKVLHYI